MKNYKTNTIKTMKSNERIGICPICNKPMSADYIKIHITKKANIEAKMAYGSYIEHLRYKNDNPSTSNKRKKKSSN